MEEMRIAIQALLGGDYAQQQDTMRAITDDQCACARMRHIGCRGKGDMYLHLSVLEYGVSKDGN